MILLFTGTETFNWGGAEFLQVCQFAREHGIDGLIVKVYEITQGEWYGGQLPVIAHDIEMQGLVFVPYGYHYGIQMQAEVTAAKKYLNAYGVYCVDAEGEWDNSSGRAIAFAKAMQGHAGELWFSTWANVKYHGWLDNIVQLKDVVSVWMPQAYSDKLYSAMFAEWPMVPNLEPTFSIVGDGDPNHPDTLVREFHGTHISLWEYQTALANPQVVDSIVKGQTTITASEKKAQDIWLSSDTLLRNNYGGPAIYNSGIYRAWLKVFILGVYNFGAPVTKEIDTVDWTGSPIKLQYFQSGIRAEWDVHNRCNFYSPDNRLVYMV